MSKKTPLRLSMPFKGYIFQLIYDLRKDTCMKIFSRKLFWGFIMSIFLCGCAEPVSIQEVLQLPMDARIYTNYNIWYEDPEDISSLNRQKGRILPFGTEVQVYDIDSRRVKFKNAADGQKFCIYYDSSMMMLPAEFYYKDLFTTKTRAENISGIAQPVIDKISKGIVEENMNRRDVLLAFGYPVINRTPSLKEDTWIYWTDKLSTIRIIFKGDKVVKILKFGE